MYVQAFVSMCVYVHVLYVSYLWYMTNYPEFPLASGPKIPSLPRIQSFHLAITHLCCFNAALNEPGNININGWDRDQSFIVGTKKVPQYTDLFWTVFFKIVPFLEAMKKEISETPDDDAIDDVREMKVRLSVFEDGDVVNADTHLLSAEIRAMVDNMLYVGCYGHRALFEDSHLPAVLLSRTSVCRRVGITY